MKLVLHSGGQPLEVLVENGEEGRSLTIEGRRSSVDRLAGTPMSGTVIVDGVRTRFLAERSGSRIRVALRGECHEFDLSAGDGGGRGKAAGTADPETRSPMPGKVLELRVAEGDRVEPGTPLLVLEAMKMENVLRAEVAGTVKQLRVAAGELVEPGELLVVLEPEEQETNDVS